MIQNPYIQNINKISVSDCVKNKKKQLFKLFVCFKVLKLFSLSTFLWWMIYNLLSHRFFPCWDVKHAKWCINRLKMGYFEIWYLKNFVSFSSDYVTSISKHGQNRWPGRLTEAKLSSITNFVATNFLGVIRFDSFNKRGQVINDTIQFHYKLHLAFLNHVVYQLRIILQSNLNYYYCNYYIHIFGIIHRGDKNIQFKS